ncbi:hypothetical protein L7F22_039919 [Adiantum nelumboides]|nr:hypothetical protein [Adiantum nelumboides]
MEGNGDKWVGRVHAVVEAPLESVWALASDSCGIPKWMPMVEECSLMQGELGMPGLVRYLRGTMFPHPSGEKSWIQERLLLMDPLHYKYAYCMEDGNVGLSGYINTVQFSDFGESTTLVQWDYEVDPVIGSEQEAILDYLAVLYKSSLKRLEYVAQLPSQNLETAYLKAKDVSSSGELSVNPQCSTVISHSEDLKTLVEDSPL